MLAWTRDEKDVNLSVCPTNACIVTKRKKNLSRFLYRTKDHLAWFSEKKNGWLGGDPFYLKFCLNPSPPGWSEIGLSAIAEHLVLLVIPSDKNATSARTRDIFAHLTDDCCTAKCENHQSDASDLRHLKQTHTVFLPTLELRRIYSDLIMCYKIVFGMVKLEIGDFFTFNTNISTRGHTYK